jgi:hypothetical protein
MLQRILPGLAGLLLSLPLYAAEYHVGPGQSLAAIADVPWGNLQPGDHVFIHWRSTPYREKWVISARGTASAPVVISGVPGTGGELPVIDGRNAVTPASLNYWGESRGVIKFGGDLNPGEVAPEYVVIENLDIRSARPAYSFTGDDNGVYNYSSNAASIYVEVARHLTIRNCILRDSGNGLFISAFYGETRDIRVEGNHIHDNGIDGSIYQHNSYTSAIGLIYQNNHFGPLRTGALGNNLKDRSAGLVVRYNWIESGNRQLDLVDAEDSTVIVNDPSYEQTFVYGNILVEPDGAGNQQILHYGGDSGSTSFYRKGTLYFYNNTVVSTRTGKTTLLRLSTNDEHADIRNNIFYVTAGGSELALLDGNGIADIRGNWFSSGWVDTHGGLAGQINDIGGNIEGLSPGFRNTAAQDYSLISTSSNIDKAVVLAAAASSYPVELQYVKHSRVEPRSQLTVADIGAYEYCPDIECQPIFFDDFE